MDKKRRAGSPIEGPRELFRKLYLQDDQKNRKIVRQKFDLKKSILDATLEDAKGLSKGLSSRDRDKLDEYFTSVREVERKIHQREKWQSIEKPSPSIDEPANKNLVEDIPVLYQLIGLALETDSTRIASFEMAEARSLRPVCSVSKTDTTPTPIMVKKRRTSMPCSHLRNIRSNASPTFLINWRTVNQ